jgi:hypothetical protein
MMIPSSLSLRRAVPRPARATRQFIVFQLRQEWFGLPVEAAQKLIPTNSVYLGSQDNGDRFTPYQNHEIPVLVLEQCLFGDQPVRHLLPAAGESHQPRRTVTAQQPCLLIVQASDGQLAALSIPVQPALRRILQTDLAPSSDYGLAAYYHHWVSLIATSEDNQTTIYILDPDRLVQSGLQ